MHCHGLYKKESSISLRHLQRFLFYSAMLEAYTRHLGELPGTTKKQITDLQPRNMALPWSCLYCVPEWLSHVGTVFEYFLNHHTFGTKYHNLLWSTKACFFFPSCSNKKKALCTKFNTITTQNVLWGIQWSQQNRNRCTYCFGMLVKTKLLSRNCTLKKIDCKVSMGPKMRQGCSLWLPC